jgi:hypothetical protein
MTLQQALAVLSSLTRRARDESDTLYGVFSAEEHQAIETVGTCIQLNESVGGIAISAHSFGASRGP